MAGNPNIAAREAAAASPSEWSPRDYVVFMVAMAVSLALLIGVGGTLYLVGTGKVDPEKLGTIKGLGKGTGLLGLVGLVAYLIPKVIPSGTESKKASRKKVVPTLGILTSIVVGFTSVTAASGLQRQMAEKVRLQKEVTALQRSRDDALAFLSEISRKENIRLINPNVKDDSWSKVVAGISAVKPGQRKKAVYGALLLAWKEIPLGFQGHDLPTGVDSPGFFKHVFASVGLSIAQQPGQRLSDAIEQQFRKVSEPTPGDLMIYKGAESDSVGHFVMMYLGTGEEGGDGISLGTFTTHQPVQIIDSYYFERVPPKDKFFGYYAPDYTD